ncbi:hypothetical protein T492DRAFT_190706 [Pavlovales sp. CCMP2436]|nr:hypothetical protein T492DRAFT_190706 [Pavlovales sp. CCMP2436]
MRAVGAVLVLYAVAATPQDRPLDVFSVTVGLQVLKAVRERLTSTMRTRAFAANSTTSSSGGPQHVHRQARPTCFVDQGSAIRSMYHVLPQSHDQRLLWPHGEGSNESSGAPRGPYRDLGKSGRLGALAAQPISAEPAKLSAQTLTRDNTRPIRIRAVYDALYEESAALFSVCFSEGAWVRVGWPKPYASPPSGGKETCHRESISEGGLSADCWLLCTPADVLSPSMREYAMNATDHTLAEAQTYLRVPERAGPLMLRKSEGTYPGFYAAVGVEGERCAADCSKLHALTVSDHLCSDGMEDADVLLYVRHPPPIPGVSGTGSACALDERGRPVVIALDWHTLPTNADSVDWPSAPAEQRADARAVILHELFHGLGFSIEHWTAAIFANGTRRALVGALPITKASIGVGVGGDADGLKPGNAETVWHFLRGTRTFEVAASFFGCADASKEWVGVPLMSYPSYGRCLIDFLRAAAHLQRIRASLHNSHPIFSTITEQGVAFRDTHLSRICHVIWGRSIYCRFGSTSNI